MVWFYGFRGPAAHFGGILVPPRVKVLARAVALAALIAKVWAGAGGLGCRCLACLLCGNRERSLSSAPQTTYPQTQCLSRMTSTAPQKAGTGVGVANHIPAWRRVRMSTSPLPQQPVCPTNAEAVFNRRATATQRMGRGMRSA